MIDQLVDELHTHLAYPLSGLCGVDLEPILSERIRQAAPRIAAELAGDDAATAAADLLVAIWGEAGPPDAWWRTELGKVCATALRETRGRGAVTQQRAADILGVTRGTVAQLVARGRLDRHPDGGVLVASVWQRICQ